MSLLVVSALVEQLRARSVLVFAQDETGITAVVVTRTPQQEPE